MILYGCVCVRRMLGHALLGEALMCCVSREWTCVLVVRVQTLCVEMARYVHIWAHECLLY